MGLFWTGLLNGGLALAAYATARYGLRQPPGLPRTLAAVGLAWAWLTTGCEALGALGAMSRGPLLGWVGLALGVALIFWRNGRGKAGTETGAGPARRWSWEEVAAGALVLW